MASQSRFINLNVASRDELASVPMIGADRADELVKKRPFASWEEIENVPGFDCGLHVKGLEGALFVILNSEFLILNYTIQ